MCTASDAMTKTAKSNCFEEILIKIQNLPFSSLLFIQRYDGLGCCFDRMISKIFDFHLLQFCCSRRLSAAKDIEEKDNLIMALLEFDFNHPSNANIFFSSCQLVQLL